MIRFPETVLIKPSNIQVVTSSFKIFFQSRFQIFKEMVCKLFLAIIFGSIVLIFVKAAPTNDVHPPGSPEYNRLLHENRNWSVSVSDASSFSDTGNGTLLGSNETQVNNVTLLVSRDKQRRIQSIQDYVLSTLGRGKRPGSTDGSTTRPEGGQTQPQPQATPFSGEIKTFLATCDVPPRVDADVWRDSVYFHIFFKLNEDINASTNATRNANETVTVPQTATSPLKRFTTISAKLRLYKLGFGEDAQIPLFETPNPSEPCNETSSNDLITPTAAIRTPLVIGEDVSLPLPPVEEKIRVSIYWYKAPVTKTHYKKKLLDTKMVSVKESKWIEFDIINAAVPWIDRHDKNFGLVVEVENEDNDWVNPSTYFANVICPGNTSNQTDNTPSTPPQLEICVLNTPSSQREVSTEPPTPNFPFQGASFRYLTQVARAHQQKGTGERSTNPLSEWQNDIPSLTSSTIRPRHKHRHGHGNGHSQGGRRRPQNTFQLDEDHPLRRILTTTGEGNKKGRIHEEIDISTETSSEDRDIIIQKIYIQGGTSSSADDVKER